MALKQSTTQKIELLIVALIMFPPNASAYLRKRRRFLGYFREDELIIWTKYLLVERQVHHYRHKVSCGKNWWCLITPSCCRTRTSPYKRSHGSMSGESMRGGWRLGLYQRWVETFCAWLHGCWELSVPPSALGRRPRHVITTPSPAFTERKLL